MSGRAVYRFKAEDKVIRAQDFKTAKVMGETIVLDLGESYELTLAIAALDFIEFRA